MLDSLDKRGGRPGVADVAQPDEPVGAVQQVGVPLIRSEELDEQRLPVLGDRNERPRAPRLDGGRRDVGDRQACRGKCRRDPVRADAPVGHAEQDERTGADRYPGCECQDHFHRRGRAGDQPRNGSQPQCGPGDAPPRTAEPRRGGDRASHGSGKKHGAHQRRAGKPRPLTGTGRQSKWTLPARELNDPGKRGACQHRDARQAGQQPEPAVTQRDGYRSDSRYGEGRLHEPRQHPARHGGRRNSSHGSSAGARIRGMRDDGNRQRPGEYQPSEDQADDVARMPVPGRWQKPAARLHGHHGWPGVDFRRPRHDFPQLTRPGSAVRPHRGARPRRAAPRSRATSRIRSSTAAIARPMVRPERADGDPWHVRSMTRAMFIWSSPSCGQRRDARDADARILSGDSRPKRSSLLPG